MKTSNIQHQNGDAKPVALSIVPTVQNGDDAGSAKYLIRLSVDSKTALRKIMAFGLCAWEIKETQLKHGQWGPWLAAHAPTLCRMDSTTGKPKASTALQQAMLITQSVLAAVGFKAIGDYFKHVLADPNSRVAGICRGGKYLLVPDRRVPDALKGLREKICILLDGNSKRQLFLEFKQAEEALNGEVHIKRGRLKGEGGASIEQRAIHRMEVAEVELIARKARIRHLGDSCDALANYKEIGDPEAAAEFEEAFPKVENLFRCMQRVRAARSQGAKPKGVAS